MQVPPTSLPFLLIVGAALAGCLGPHEAEAPPEGFPTSETATYHVFQDGNEVGSIAISTRLSGQALLYDVQGADGLGVRATGVVDAATGRLVALATADEYWGFVGSSSFVPTPLMAFIQGVDDASPLLQAWALHLLGPQWPDSPERVAAGVERSVGDDADDFALRGRCSMACPLNDDEWEPHESSMTMRPGELLPISATLSVQYRGDPDPQQITLERTAYQAMGTTWTPAEIHAAPVTPLATLPRCGNTPCEGVAWPEEWSLTQAEARIRAVTMPADGPLIVGGIHAGDPATVLAYEYLVLRQAIAAYWTPEGTSVGAVAVYHPPGMFTGWQASVPSYMTSPLPFMSMPGPTMPEPSPVADLAILDEVVSMALAPSGRSLDDLANLYFFNGDKATYPDDEGRAQLLTWKMEDDEQDDLFVLASAQSGRVLRVTASDASIIERYVEQAASMPGAGMYLDEKLLAR